LELKPRDYQTDRLKTWFNSSALFYMEFNIRLFLRLFRLRADIYLGNDLDVMPYPQCCSSGKPIVYDSHEYFWAWQGWVKNPFGDLFGGSSKCGFFQN
jgi:hypothetical protein